MTVLEGRYGYLRAYSPRPEPARLVEGLGHEWLAADLIIKAYPCHVTSQAVVHALQRFKRDHPIDPHRVGRVQLSVNPHATEERHLDRAPKTLLGAQYSLPFTTAVALTRDLADPFVFDESVLGDPTVGDLARRIEIRADAERFGGAARSSAEVILEQAGKTHTLRGDGFPGSAAQPLDLDGAADKLRRYAEPLVGAGRVEELVGLVRDLERLDDVGRLAQLIRA